MSVLSFGLIGAAGYIAPRHMQAVKAIGCEIKVAFDPNDSVGILDTFFPDASFSSEFERFDRHVDKLRRRGEQIDWISICSPNYLHDAHCRFSLRSDADVICEKPLVLNPWNLDGLAELEAASGRRIFTILQLRHHLDDREPEGEAGCLAAQAAERRPHLHCQPGTLVSYVLEREMRRSPAASRPISAFTFLTP